MAATWFYSANGRCEGPADVADLRRLIAEGHLARTVLVWKEGMTDWVEAPEVPGLLVGPPPLPPAAGSSPGQTAAAPMPGAPSVAPAARDSADSAPSATLPLCFLIALLVTTGLVAALGLVGLLLWLPAVVGCAVTVAIFIYRCWRCLPAAERRPTPGQMVGYLFIPFFNLYWVFIAVRGLSKSTAEELRDRGLPAPGLPGLATAVCVLFVAAPVLSALPLLQVAFLAAAPTVCGLWLLSQAQATRRLVGAESAEAAMPLWTFALLTAEGTYLLLALLTLSLAGSPASGLGNKSPVTIDATFLIHEFRAGKSTATVKYYNQPLLVSGTITCKDAFSLAYFTDPDTHWMVVYRFRSPEEFRKAKERQGELVTVRGTCIGVPSDETTDIGVDMNGIGEAIVLQDCTNEGPRTHQQAPGAGKFVPADDSMKLRPGQPLPGPPPDLRPPAGTEGPSGPDLRPPYKPDL